MAPQNQVFLTTGIKRVIKRELGDTPNDYVVNTFQFDTQYTAEAAGREQLSKYTFCLLPVAVYKRQLTKVGDDLVELMRILNAIQDLVHDPEHGFTVVRLGVANMMVEYLLHDACFVREKICRIFLILATQAAGRSFIIRRYKAVQSLAVLLEDSEDDVRYHATKVMEALSRHFVGADALNDANFTIIVMKRIRRKPQDETDEVYLLLLYTLRTMLDRGVTEYALQNGCMELLLEKLQHHNGDIVGAALHCIMILCWHPLGKQLADEMKILTQVCPRLYDNRQTVHSKAVAAVTFATLTINGKHSGYSLNICDRLLELALTSFCKETKMFSVKALTNLSESVEGRRYMKCNKYEQQLRCLITCDDKDVNFIKHLETLFKVINWKP